MATEAVDTRMVVAQLCSEWPFRKSHRASVRLDRKQNGTAP